MCYLKKEDLLLNSITVGGLVYSLQIQILKHYDASDFLGVTFLKKYNRLAEYLSSQVNAQTSVEDLATLYNLSRVAFTRNFTTETGITPKKLIDRYTLNRCLDLMNKGISSKEISSTLHFSNEFAFSRFFKSDRQSQVCAFAGQIELEAFDAAQKLIQQCKKQNIR